MSLYYSVVGGWINEWVWVNSAQVLTERNGIGRSETSYSAHKFHIDLPGIDPGTPQWEGGDWSFEPAHVTVIF
jgi:hypothetical protein